MGWGKGMDIKQHLNARAVLTLGKDMTFRDYSRTFSASVFCFLCCFVRSLLRLNHSLTFLSLCLFD